ncbi:hypothetical protein HMF8227_01749 [Saliniradius amylolyticus]|uniref:Uncharacterized protein n=1 Tax=Saliniradius amylolyticus TaxID=2183582 RepID=A0A2S2E3Y1_9ALTE|nr:hypothetical protein [Saliniradius amylolyticus]AWL12222.1 hypothetical protein HMF8227_01749 [Saliniradius amylolyticus]
MLIYSLASYVVLIVLRNKLASSIYLVAAGIMLALDGYTLYSMHFRQGGGSTAALVLFYLPTVKLLLVLPLAFVVSKVRKVN